MNDDNIIRKIEEISNNALPSLNTYLYDGWLLRTSYGFTKRANSVSPLYPSYLDLKEKINFCESFYMKKGLPLIFKLFDCAYPNNIDTELQKRDYMKYDDALVI